MIGQHDVNNNRETSVSSDILKCIPKKISFTNFNKNKEKQLDDKFNLLPRSKSMVDIETSKNTTIVDKTIIDDNLKISRRKSFIESNRNNGKPRKYFDSAEYYMNKETGQICCK